MPTGQVIVTNALTALGIVSQGEIPNVSDSNYGVGELNDMWQSWGIDEGLIYAIQSLRLPLLAFVGSYTIGVPANNASPQPNFNNPRPSRIYQAYSVSATGNAINANALYSGGAGYAVGDTGIILGAAGVLATYTVSTVSGTGAVITYVVSGAGTGYIAMQAAATAVGGAQPGVGVGFRVMINSVTAGGQNRNELNIVAAQQYYSHNDLSAQALTPDELYPDYNVNQDGFATLLLWPVPSDALVTNLELEAAVPFSAWSLTGNYNVPQAYQDCIKWTLAFRMLSGFGAIVAQQVAQVVATEAVKAEERLRSMNAFNRRMPPAEAPGTQKQAAASQAAQ